MKELAVEGELGYTGDREESINKSISQVFTGLEKRNKRRLR